MPSSSLSLSIAIGTSGPSLVPDAPTIGTATSGGVDANASVTFTPPVRTGGSPITGYTVTSTPGSFTGTGSSSPIVVNNLLNNTAYTFAATATNAVGTGAASSASNQITTPATTVPQSPTINTVTPGHSRIVIDFTPRNNGGSGVTVYHATANPGNHTGNNTVSPVTVTGLTDGVTYTVTVDATNANGTSVQSDPGTGTPTITVPDAPTIGTAVAGNTQASVPFTAPSNNGGSVITSYTATSTPGSFTGVLSQAGSGTIVVTGLINGTPYTFTVHATSAIGNSAESSASNSVTPGNQSYPFIGGMVNINSNATNVYAQTMGYVIGS